jgi:hypothetical protein
LSFWVPFGVCGVDPPFEVLPSLRGIEITPGSLLLLGPCALGAAELVPLVSLLTGVHRPVIAR